MREEIILASKSPFRAQLLANAGIDVEICGADIDERAVEAAFIADYAAKFSAGSRAARARKAMPLHLAEALAVAKAREVARRFPDAVIIGCDQILQLGKEILHKTANEEEAFQRLRALSGKTHYLHSAFAVMRGEKLLAAHMETAAMTMRALSDNAISAYMRRSGQDILKSVGAYQIEGEGICLFDEIKGDYWTIIGLPLLPLLRVLRRFGFLQEET